MSICSVFFKEQKPQIEKYLSIQAEEELMFNKISANLVNLGYVSILSSQNRRVLKILFKLSLFLADKNARKTSTSFSTALIMISLSNSGLLVGVWKLLKKKLLAEIGVFIKGVVNCSLISLDKLES